ncbi:hypothetical protein M427DRAFT_290685 [Gonapodya prolifera JEL478]|uniref:BCS1 N-terminal domain-containing protein n=1 Tax=Gonapodya prolifera (strain JEL478) TaxID=1344416 RepID=A0A139AHY6_GONPJ|nr:hypothetical protein M427DRAFT_290685 [Gonapodya prolifera JEL478]|eukprot:KXS16441.1 hypothetical protein M427DRAFT_290685 [Gonapodya prolifera JEL478]
MASSCGRAAGQRGRRWRGQSSREGGAALAQHRGHVSPEFTAEGSIAGLCAVTSAQAIYTVDGNQPRRADNSPRYFNQYLAVAQKKPHSTFFCTKGLTIAIAGTVVLGVIRPIFGFLSEYLDKALVARVDFQTNQESYSWILNYLANHPIASTSLQFTVVNEIPKMGTNQHPRMMMLGMGMEQDTWELGNELEWLPKAYFLPADGSHFFWYRRHLLHVRIGSRNND